MEGNKRGLPQGEEKKREAGAGASASRRCDVCNMGRKTGAG